MDATRPNEPVRVLGGDYPLCAHEGCRKLAEDGYCEASCCRGSFKAYCSEHSHRPTHVLEVLGHAPTQETFTRAEVRDILLAMWIGAGMVFESAGKLAMMRDLEVARAARSGGETG